jgi:CheY-like chemotaxis protein
MTVDSQRSASTVHADRGESRVNDAWLGPVLVAGGVLTPDQLADLAEAPAPVRSGEPAGSSARTLVHPAAEDSGPTRILVADDDPQMRRLIKSVLRGLGVLEALRAQIRTASPPVIVLTAQHGESEEKALDLGAQDYLTKLVQTRSLVARVRAVLKRVNS